MKELVSKYPSLVARPYLLIKDDLQKKDMQRFWFENTISFLASVVGSELISWYKELKNKEDKNEDEIALIKSLQTHPSLTNVGLEHMSLGKWVMMLRETIKVLKENNVNVVCPEILEFYNKENEAIINKLVTIRNNDAHGEPIPEDKLESELNKRQEMIDKLVQNLSFLENYQLIMPEKIELEGNKQFYLTKEFVGNNIITSKKEFEFNPRLNDLILINKNRFISLIPNIVYLGIADESKSFLGVLSKFVDKDKKVAKYLNLDGSGEIDYRKTKELYQIDFLEERKHIDEVYSDPESFSVNLNIDFKFDEDSIYLNQESGFSLKIDNKKSTDLENLEVKIDIPDIMTITELPTDIENLKEIKNNKTQLVLTFENVEDQIIEIENIKFKIDTQGFFTLERGIATYDFYKTIADKDAGLITTEEIEFSGGSIEVIDPASKDKIVPVVNVYKRFLNTAGEEIEHIKIGEDFIFEVKIKNIGFSSAKDISVDVLFPEGLSLKKGKESIKISQLNPLEEKVFQYVFSSKTANIYNIAMQNVLYYDMNKKRYFTQCSDEYFIIVRSDLLKEFKFKIEEFIADLYIDESEQREIDKTIKELEEKLGIDGKQFYQEAEHEAVRNIIREIVEKTAIKKDIVINESIYQETKRDSRYTGENPRKFLVYSAGEFPFFAINLDDMEFYGMETNINKRFNKVTKKLARVSSEFGLLEHMIDYDTVRNTEEYSVPFFNQWINMILTKIQKEYFLWSKIKEEINKTFNIELRVGNGDFVADLSSPTNVIQKVTLFMQRSNPNTYLLTFPINREIQTHKKVEIKNFDTYLAMSVNKDKNTYTEEPNRLGYYWVITDRKANNFAIKMKVKNENDIPKFVNKAKELYKELLYISSLNLVEEYESEELNDFITKLYKKGFYLRKIDDYGEKIAIFSLDDNSIFFEAKDAISYMEETKKGFDFYIKTYFNIDELSENISINNFSWWKNIPLYLMKIKNPKEILKVYEYILKVADEYHKDKLFIWPKPLQKELVLNFANTEYGVFKTFLAYSQGKRKVDEVIEYFPNEKEWSYFVRRNNQIRNDYKTLPIFEIDDEVKINDEYIDTYEELKQQNNFEYLNEGGGFYRLVILDVMEKLNIKFNIGRTWASRTISVKNSDILKSFIPYVSFLKGYKLNIGVEFNAKDVDKVMQMLKEFDFNIDVKIEFAQKSKNPKVVIEDISIENYEQNKDKIISQIGEFFSEIDRFLVQFEVSLYD